MPLFYIYIVENEAKFHKKGQKNGKRVVMDPYTALKSESPLRCSAVASQNIWESHFVHTMVFGLQNMIQLILGNTSWP